MPQMYSVPRIHVHCTSSTPKKRGATSKGIVTKPYPSPGLNLHSMSSADQKECALTTLSAPCRPTSTFVLRNEHEIYTCRLKTPVLGAISGHVVNSGIWSSEKGRIIISKALNFSLKFIMGSFHQKNAEHTHTQIHALNCVFPSGDFLHPVCLQMQELMNCRTTFGLFNDKGLNRQ